MALYAAGGKIRSINLISSTRLPAPAFLSIIEAWLFAVVGLMPCRSAISAKARFVL